MASKSKGNSVNETKTAEASGSYAENRVDTGVDVIKACPSDKRVETDNTTETHVKDSSGTVSSEICGDHSKVKLFFCETHRLDCCGVCVSSQHKSCTIVTMNNVDFNFSRYLKRINAFRPAIESRMGKLQNHSQRVESFIKNGETQVQDFYNEVRRKIDEAEGLTLKIVEYIRELELSGIQYLFSECDVVKERIDNIIAEGALVDEQVAQPRKSILQMSTQSTGADEETFHGISLPPNASTTIIDFQKGHESEVLCIEKALAELDVLSDDINMGFVKKNVDIVSDLYLNISRLMSISALCPANHHPVKVLTPSGEFSCEGIIKSIATLPNADGEYFIVTEMPNKLQRVGISGKVYNYVALSGQPNDLCVYSKFVAITFKTISQINVYHKTDLTVHYQIKLPSGCWGICRIDECFVVTFHGEHVIRKISDNGNIVSVSDSRFASPSFVRTSECGTYVLVSDTNSNSVVAMSTCADLKSVLFTIDVPSPLGLCAFPNRNSSVFVCSEVTHFVGSVSKGGEPSVTIDSQKCGVAKPHSLCYNAHSRTLAVTIDSQVKLFRAE